MTKIISNFVVGRILFNSLPPIKYLNSITVFEDCNNNMNNEVFKVKWLLERVQKKSNT